MIKWPVDAIRVELPRLQTRNENMPVVIGSVNNRVQRNHTRRARIVFVIKQQQLDSRSIA